MLHVFIVKHYSVHFIIKNLNTQTYIEDFFTIQTIWCIGIFQTMYYRWFIIKLEFCGMYIIDIIFKCYLYTIRFLRYFILNTKDNLRAVFGNIQYVIENVLSQNIKYEDCSCIFRCSFFGISSHKEQYSIGQKQKATNLSKCSKIPSYVVG